MFDRVMDWTLCDVAEWSRELLGVLCLREPQVPLLLRGAAGLSFEFFAGADLNSRTAGWFHAPARIRLHPRLTVAHARRTLGHEVAHYLEYLDAGERKFRREDHGPTWRRWMRALGLDATQSTHEYEELSPAARGAVVYAYACRDCGATFYSTYNFNRCHDKACRSLDIKQRVAASSELAGARIIF